MKGVTKYIGELILIVIAVIILGVLLSGGVLSYAQEIFCKFGFGISSKCPDGDLTKTAFAQAVECSYLRCALGCDKFNANDFSKVKCPCNPDWQENGKICGWNAAQYPVEFQAPTAEYTKDSFKDSIKPDCIYPYGFAGNIQDFDVGSFLQELSDKSHVIVVGDRSNADVNEGGCQGGKPSLDKFSLVTGDTYSVYTERLDDYGRMAATSLVALFVYTIPFDAQTIAGVKNPFKPAELPKISSRSFKFPKLGGAFLAGAAALSVFTGIFAGARPIYMTNLIAQTTYLVPGDPDATYVYPYNDNRGKKFRIVYKGSDGYVEILQGEPVSYRVKFGEIDRTRPVIPIKNSLKHVIPVKDKDGNSFDAFLIGFYEDKSDAKIKFYVSRPLSLVTPATFYDEPNYGDFIPKPFGIGKWNLVDFGFDNKITSFKIPLGIKVTLYSEDNLKGEFCIIDKQIEVANLAEYKDDKCKGNWDNHAKSMKIEYNEDFENN